MNLSALVGKMWERLGRGIYVPIWKPITDGERLFTTEQIDVFCDILGLSDERRKRLHDAADRDRFYALWEKTTSLRRTIGEDASEEKSLAADLDFIAPTPWPSQPSVFTETKRVLEKAIQLVVSAPALPKPHCEKMYLAFQGADDIFDLFPELRSDWWHALRTALNRGWDIIHLVRLNEDPNRTLILVTDVLELLGAPGEYIPLYFPRYGPLQTHELLLVPTIGALEFYTTKQPHHMDAASFYPMGDHLQVRYEYLTQLSRMTLPLLQIYPPDKEFDFQTIIAGTEEKAGGKFLFKDGLSRLTFPLPLHEQYLRKGGCPEEEIRWQDRHLRSRRDSFGAQVEKHKILNICPRSAVERLVRDGELSRADAFCENDYRAYKPTKAERRKHLANVVHLLSTYKNFELALPTDEELQSFMPHCHTRGSESLYPFWQVKEGHNVVIEAWYWEEEEEKPKGPSLVITERVFVESFWKYSENLWNRISPQSKDKEWVKQWLRDQVGVLEKPG